MKGRKSRSILLPTALFNELELVKGQTYLWESFPESARRFRPCRNRPAPERFDPKSRQHTLENIFREYGERHPDRPHLSPHDLRRWAITEMTEITGSVDLAAEAASVTTATARRYYVARRKALNTDDLFTKLAGKLVVGPAPTLPTEPTGEK